MLSTKELEKVLDTLTNIPRVVNFAVEPEGKRLVFSSPLTETYQLYLLNTDRATDEYQQLTFAKDPIMFGFELSNSGRWLAYPREEGGTEDYKIFLMDLEQSKPEELSLTPEPIGRIMGLEWFPDEKNLLITVSEKKFNAVKILNIDSQEFTTIFESERLIEPRLSRTGKNVAISVNQGPDLKNRDMIVFPTENPNDQQVISYSQHSEEKAPGWANNDQYLAFLSNVDNKPVLIIWDVENWSERYKVDIPEDPADTVLNWQLLPLNEPTTDLFYNCDYQGKMRLFHYHLHDTKVNALDLPGGSALVSSVTKERLFYLSSSFSHPHQIRFLNYPDLTEFRKPLPSEIPQLQELPKFEYEQVWYESFDGKKIQSWFLNPDPNGERPVIMEIHGGPTGSNVDMFDQSLIVPVLAGFSVFAPNFRGSTGFGTEFRLSNIGDLGGGDFQDVLHGVDWLQEKGYLKKNPPVIAGASYGGYMTLYALTKKPDLWKCGVAGVPISDWIALYESGDAIFKFFGNYFFEGKPEEKRELYVERSPVTYIDNLKGPLFIQHGKNDSRCPFKPVYEFFEKAKQLGADVELEAFEAEGHGTLQLSNQFREYIGKIRFLYRQFGFIEQ